MQDFSAIEILEGIKNRDTKVLDFIYENFFHPVKLFVMKNSGSLEDAQDIYQDAVLVIYQKVLHENLTLTCSFKTYLYSVCRLLWLKQLEKRRINNRTAEEAGLFIELAEDIFSINEKNDRYKLYQDHFKKLSFSCQKVLELFLAKIPLKEIARILGFKSEQYVKKRKFQCKEKLIQSIKSDPNFLENSKIYTIKNS
ncbi:MAG: sigma-70 family RNA polymerase sigma factor [Bacteroidales bacterium]|nr:sigma-70 family RNA polymerase sigma factor [Bacteroidales bacterium]MCF8404978.1 sigma-70 family RNA polymerase sigma factor [Bacteroidales bacterium]